MVADAVNAFVHSILRQLSARSVGSLCAEHQPVRESLLLLKLGEAALIRLEHDSDNGFTLDRSRLVSSPDRLGTITIYGKQPAIAPSSIGIVVVSDFRIRSRNLLGFHRK